MSSEQAKGKAVDKRADIWAFGCVLYECLTDKRAFEGETLAETLASILKGEPDWPLLPHSVPRLLSTLLHRSLEKDPKRRLRHMGDMLILMEEARAEPSAALPAGPSLGPGPRGRTMILSLVALVGAAVGAALWTLIGASDKPPLLTRLVINPPSSAPITRHFGNDLALSPDGRLVIYRARQGGVIQPYLRSLDDLEATPIPGTERALPDFFFSSDSQSVVFQVASELKRVPLAGGPSVTLCEMPGALTGGIWEPDGTIVFSAGAHGIYRVAAAGGRPESLAVPDLDRGEVQYSHPEALPGGEAVLFSIAGGEGWQTATLSLEMREKKILVEGARQAHYAATGHLVYERAGTGTLMAVPFDLAKLEISGDSTSIQEGVRQVPSDGVDYAFSVDGTLVYVPSQALEGRRSLVWVDREGRESLVTRGDRDIAAPRLSPDGHQVAFTQMKDGSPESIWTYDLDRESFNRVTFEGIQAGTVAWSRNGKWLAYYLNEDGRRSIHRQPVDGSAQPEQLDTSDNLRIVMSWSPDGRFISFGESRPSRDVGILPTEGNEKPFYLIDSPANECCAVFSPDGKWLAYVSDESGRDQVYVRPFPEPDTKILISQEGGQEPVWSSDGREPFFRSGDRMMSVSLQTSPRFAAGKPVVLFEGSYRGPDSNPAGYQYYDISRDGQKFLMVREEEQQTPIHVILNWFEELKRLVPND